MMNVSFPPELAGLIQAIERDHYARPESVLGPLRQLLQQCTDLDQVAYACEKLGFAHLRLGEHRMSRVFYEHAMQLQPNNFYILANLAHAVHELGDTEIAVGYGRRALRLKDQSVMQDDPGQLQPPHQGSRRLISFSLYGDGAKYCETAVLNCLAAKQHFPDFVCRFHVDDSVPPAILRRLEEQGAEIVSMSGRGTGLFPTAWRFLPLDDRTADVVLVRDVDSLLDAREAHCVREWIDSGKPFHIIRDDCCHTELILAGLFAARAGVLGRIEDRLAEFVRSTQDQGAGRYSDQLFLRQCVWPLVKDHAVTHDRIYGYGTDVRGVPTELPQATGPQNAFMGAGYATYQVNVALQQPLAQMLRCHLRIFDERGVIVCEHRMERLDDQTLQIQLPPNYARNLETGVWKHELLTQPELG
jgi:acetolactate synthase regulatory subunit